MQSTGKPHGPSVLTDHRDGRYITCMDKMCVANNGRGKCTSECVNRKPESCIGRRLVDESWY